jgi:hypothetical protein
MENLFFTKKEPGQRESSERGKGQSKKSYKPEKRAHLTYKQEQWRIKEEQRRKLWRYNLRQQER